MPYPYYNPYQYGQNLPTQNPQVIPQTQPQMQTPFVMVRSEAEARNYPVGFGNVVSFKDENSPYIYTKTMGFSQSDKPVFDKYRKEEVKAVEEPKKECHCDGFKEEISDLKSQIESMRKELDSLKERRANNEHNRNGKSNQN